MKTKITLLLLMFSLCTLAQTNIPQLVSFSAVVRDANNVPLINTNVSIRLTFKQGGQNGPMVYCALHQTTTNQNGFMSLLLNREVLGTSCNGAPNTNFENIPWENGNFWMEVEYQTVPNTPFESLGQLELASSFYAFAAGTAERLTNFNLSNPSNGDVLVYNAALGQWVPGQAQGASFQNLSVSNSGDTLYINNGNWVIIPGISAANTPPGFQCPPTAGISENFNSTLNNVIVDLVCWSNIATIGTRFWQGRDGTDANGKHIQATSFSSGGQNEIWFISPLVFSNGSNTLSFETQTSFWTHNALSVYVSVDFNGSNPNSATWIPIPAALAGSSSGNSWIFSGLINLQNYLPLGFNGSFVIGFKYDGNGNQNQTSSYRIDNVSIN